MPAFQVDAWFCLSKGLSVIIWQNGNLQVYSIKIQLFNSFLPDCVILHRPTTSEELYNLHHASARNIIERIFGVLKRHFQILVHPPEYDMQTQARLPAALGTLHNFIHNNDPDDVADFEDDDENLYDGGQLFMGELADGVPNRVERAWASQRQESIAKAMWEQYLQEKAARGL